LGFTCAVIVACSHTEPASRVTLEPPVARAQATTSGAITRTLLPPKAIAWEWRGDQPGFGRSFYRAPRTVTEGDLACSFTYVEAASVARIGCTSNGRALWSVEEPHAFVADAALVLHRGTLYAARYSDISSGCTLHAFDARTGTKRWTRELAGIGPIAHSEYLNAVELRVIDERPVVFGWESAGRYVEALDPATGADAVHTTFPP
jgi:hypothetical protein